MKGLSRDPSCTKGVFMDELAKRNDSSPAVINDDFAVETFRAAIERRQEKVHNVIEKKSQSIRRTSPQMLSPTWKSQASGTS